jgi:lipopolysaccharide export system protein LptC
LNQQGTTTGVGMKLDTEQQKLDILTKVRGTYVPATTN